MATYFYNRLSSSERDPVENAVRLTRRVGRRKTNYELISDDESAMPDYWLSTPRRKRFGFLTPLGYAQRVALTG